MSHQTLIPSALPPGARPENGLAGLKHYQADWAAGLVVALVSLPLSSGIAIASGAPPVYGLISSIIAGFVFPLVGGTYVTIAGPAAGLAPILAATMVALGGAGDAETVGVGYPLLLAVIFCVGVCQLVLSWLRLAPLAAILPSSVVEGMLGAIGVLIVLKSLPMCFGVSAKSSGHGLFDGLWTIPTTLELAPTLIAVLALATLVTLGTKSRLIPSSLRRIPPPLLAVGLGMVLAAAFNLRASDPRFLIQLPANPLSAVQLPAFGLLISSSQFWYAAAVGVVTLTLVDSVESLATAMAVDRIDPWRRRSNPNRLLAAMGISNILSSLVGGLTIIPGGVKSKTNVEAGGKTLWSNLASASVLTAFLLVAPGVVGLIPKAALGAILVYTGYKMCEPTIVRHIASIGREEFFVYLGTIGAILLTDLLIGIVIGTLLQLFFNVAIEFTARKKGIPLLSLPSLFARNFKTPVERVEHDGSGDVTRLYLEGPLTCFNAFRLGEAVAALTPTKTVALVLGRGVDFVDHTAFDLLVSLRRVSAASKVEVEGLDEFVKLSKHDRASRIRAIEAAPSPAPSFLPIHLSLSAELMVASLRPSKGEFGSEPRRTSTSASQG